MKTLSKLFFLLLLSVVIYSCGDTPKKVTPDPVETVCFTQQQVDSILSSNSENVVIKTVHKEGALFPCGYYEVFYQNMNKKIFMQTSNTEYVIEDEVDGI